MRITSRKMTRQDVDAVVQLHLENIREVTGGDLSSVDTDAIRRWIAHYPEADDLFAFVAEVDTETGSQIVGYVLSVISRHPAYSGGSGQIEELFVQPAYRRQKVGSALVDAAMTALHGHEPDCVIRVHVCADNAEAQVFWLQMACEADLVAFSRYA